MKILNGWRVHDFGHAGSDGGIQVGYYDQGTKREEWTGELNPTGFCTKTENNKLVPLADVVKTIGGERYKLGTPAKNG